MKLYYQFSLFIIVIFSLKVIAKTGEQSTISFFKKRIQKKLPFQYQLIQNTNYSNDKESNFFKKNNYI